MFLLWLTVSLFKLYSLLSDTCGCQKSVCSLTITENDAFIHYYLIQCCYYYCCCCCYCCFIIKVLPYPHTYTHVVINFSAENSIICRQNYSTINHLHGNCKHSDITVFISRCDVLYY